MSYEAAAGMTPKMQAMLDRLREYALRAVAAPASERFPWQVIDFDTVFYPTAATARGENPDLERDLLAAHDRWVSDDTRVGKERRWTERGRNMRNFARFIDYLQRPTIVEDRQLLIAAAQTAGTNPYGRTNREIRRYIVEMRL